MEAGQAEQLEYILANMTIGVATLDATSLRVHYANAYLISLLAEPWHGQDVRGHSIEEILPSHLQPIILPVLRQVAATGQPVEYQAIPYEGFLEIRGRTYWHVRVECAPTPTGQHNAVPHALLITVEDVTNTTRSHLHLNAIQYISSAIAGPSALHLVLERILQVLQEMVGSKRCAVLLMDQTMPDPEGQTSPTDEPQRAMRAQTAFIAAQKDIHPRSQDWHPRVDEHLLLGRVMQERHTMMITDTSTTPEIEFPFLNNKGTPQRPGSALCVPIFDPHPPTQRSTLLHGAAERQTETVLGSIEVYHRRARGFPAEEVQLLERFAQQVGLAIQNARLFRSTDRWARVASRHARQKENIMQAIPDGVIIYDPRWRIADVNHAARQLLGWSDDIIGVPMAEAFKRSTAVFQADIMHQPHLTEEIEQRAMSGQIDEFKMISATRQTCSMRCTYTPIRDELGDIFAFIVIFHDVSEEVAARERIEAEVVARTSELKQRNEALQQARIEQAVTNARINLLLERLPSGVILVSADDAGITVINRHAVQMLQNLGVPLEPLDNPDEAGRRAIGIDCEQLLRSLHAHDASGKALPYEEHPLYKALVAGQSSETELQTTRADGQIVHLLINTTPLRATNGTISSAILVFQEITRIKTLERAREDFFTTMAHELKTPLANIRAHLSALLARDLSWSNEEQHDFLQTADEQVDRLVGMINHFLDASRVEAGALRLELEPIIIPELFEDLQDRLEALITASQRELHITLTPDIPAVRGDYELIMSVLSNLLSNAFRYTPEGHVVHLAAEPVSEDHHQPAEIRFSVTDHGPGISQEQQAELFTRFSTFAAMSRPSVHRPGQPTLARQHNTTRWSPATGLGLYISRGIIEAHGSTLQVTSSPGQGATFAFTLSIFKEAQTHNAADTSQVL